MYGVAIPTVSGLRLALSQVGAERGTGLSTTPSTSIAYAAMLLGSRADQAAAHVQQQASASLVLPTETARLCDSRMVSLRRHPQAV